MLTSESNYLDIDLDYLERIVFKTCLEDEIYLNSIIDNLNYKFFKNKNFQQIIKIIQALYKKNKKRPSRTELELYLNTDQLKEHYEKSKTVINDIKSDLTDEQLYSYTEKFFSHYMGVLATYILKIKLYEINAQPTIFNKELVEKLNHPPKDFRFDTYVYWVAMRNNYKVIRDEFNFPKREYGNSKWNFGLKSRLKFSKLLINYFYELKKTE